MLRRVLHVGLVMSLFVSVAITGDIVRARPALAATSPGTLVSAVPASTTPNIEDGTGYTVESIVQVGTTIVQGGLFTTVDPPGTTSGGLPRTDIFANDATTGALSTTFIPTVNGDVDALAAGPIAGTVYIGGSFSMVDGVKSKGLALLNLSDGSLVAGFTAPVLDGIVTSLVLVGGRLYVGGTFTKMSGKAHAGIGSVNATTGKVDPYLTVQLAGHHNYGVNCQGDFCGVGAVGVQQLAVSPDGTQLMLVGNFTSATDGVAAYHRDQVARILLGTSSATVDPNWATQRYTAACLTYFDGYMRGVAYSPDGSYFAIVATGAGTPDPSSNGCDAVARFESASSGQSVQPTWVDYTGSDTLFAVAVTSSAVYVGGHQRWLNNADGPNSAAAGAVPRPGIAALDPTNGLPFTWNPGRSPRGDHVSVLYATPAGLWVGGDTDYIGNRQYYRGKDSFFPYAGGETLPASATTALPASVYLAGPPTAGTDTLDARTYDGTTVGASSIVPISASWSSVTGAFMVDGRLFYAQDNGNFYSATFDGSSLGPYTPIDPYDDPTWDGVQTGSGQTYQGVKSSFYREIPTLTGLTYAGGYIFYTVRGSATLFYRSFEPESGVTGDTELTASSAVDLSNIDGMFVSGGRLYWADATSGDLLSAPFSGPGTPGGIATAPVLTGPATVADATSDWRARALFLAPGKPHPPVAAFTSSCTAASCSFDGTSSTATGIATYAWSFGDGTTGAGLTIRHAYAVSGTYPVSLTVTDSRGATSTDAGSVQVTVAPGTQISAVGVRDKNSSASSPSVAVPPGTAVGDLMLLFVSVNGNPTSLTGPGAGWTAVGSQTPTGMATSVWQKVATAADLGGTAGVSFGSASPKSDVELVSYHGVAAAGVRAVASTSDTNVSGHTTPGLSTVSPNDWVVSYWADKSSSTASSWTTPAGQTVRSTSIGGATSAHVDSLLTDYGGPAGSSAPGLTSVSNGASGKATEWTIELAGS